MASRSSVLVTALGALSLVVVGVVGGCSDESPTRSSPSCDSGVAIVLESFGARFASALPVQLRACFDQDCDVVRIIEQNGAPACDWDPGGPPAQLTTCTVRRDGGVEIDIARVDGKEYGDGAPHVLGVSVRAGRAGDGDVLYEHVEQVRLIGSVDSACYVDALDLRP